MRLDRNARTFRDSRIVGHERVIPIDDLVAMGYDRGKCGLPIQGANALTAHYGNRLMRVPVRRQILASAVGVKLWEMGISRSAKVDRFPGAQKYVCAMGGVNAIVLATGLLAVSSLCLAVAISRRHNRRNSVANLVVNIQRNQATAVRGVLNSLAKSGKSKTVVRTHGGYGRAP